jgi:demethylmenaquinone methyltransferase / 2-methoxy-6-polyprenyl-1,4-benzoquinol methylase
MMTHSTKPTHWISDESQKSDAVRRLFAKIAPTYDLLNFIMSFSLDGKWRNIAAKKLNLKLGDSALDLCTGTGDFLKPLRKAVGSQGSLIGLDFCEPMIRVAIKKHAPGSFALGDALNLPIQNESLNGVSVGWGIRNVSDIDQVHREIARVLKPGGRFVSLDMAKPENGKVRKFVHTCLSKGVPLLGKLFGKKEAYTYFPQSILHFWERDQLADSMRQAGLIEVTWQNKFFGNICIHSGVKPFRQSLTQESKN